MPFTQEKSEHAKERVSPQGVALTGFTGFCIAWLVAGLVPLKEAAPFVFLGFVAIPMVAVSLFINRSYRRGTAEMKVIPGPIDVRRISIKTLGFLLTLGLLALVYWLIPEYHRPYYHPVWQMAGWLALPVLISAVPYIIWVDRRMVDPCDGYWHVGLLAVGRFRLVEWKQVKAHSLGWLVKGFFLPFMLAGVSSHLTYFTRAGIQFDSFPLLFATFFTAILTLDVVFGSVGYLLTFRVLDAHIRSTETTMVGWVSALLCYAPFAAFWSAVFGYKGPTDWKAWLQFNPVLYITWGFIILLLHVVYVWSTCSFGCRFSNLTNRGIITDGPYRYLKHPAYVSKNVAWWLMAVPFVAHGTWQERIWACFCLGLINFVYAVRAWTEERHLGKDPEYVAYSAWMAENGLLARVARAFRKSTKSCECPV